MQNFWVAQGTLQAQKVQASLGGGTGGDAAPANF